MKTAEVKGIARSWVQIEGPKLRGYQGAYFIGSINTRPDESDYPPTSDVDIHFVLHLDELRAAFDYAIARRQTRFPYDSAVTEPARRATIDGTKELIEGGNHREAMLPLLWDRAMCQIAIDYDAPPAEQARYDRQYEQLLQSLGLTTPDDHVARAGLAQRTFDRIRVAAAAMMDKNPAITA